MLDKYEDLTMLCEYCFKRAATHFCTGCGHWVCDDKLCNARAGAKTLLSKALGMIGRS